MNIEMCGAVLGQGGAINLAFTKPVTLPGPKDITLPSGRVLDKDVVARIRNTQVEAQRAQIPVPSSDPLPETTGMPKWLIPTAAALAAVYFAMR